MLVRFTKAKAPSRNDTFTAVLPDGSERQVNMDRSGVLPFEAIRFVVEATLGWNDGFFGSLRRRRGRAGVRTPRVCHSEAVAHVLQDEQWSGPSDRAGFMEKIAHACRRHGVSTPDLSETDLHRLRVSLREFGAAWRPLRPGESLDRTLQ